MHDHDIVKLSENYLSAHGISVLDTSDEKHFLLYLGFAQGVGRWMQESPKDL